MKELLHGYRRFRETEWPERRRLYHYLARRGQHPRAIVLGCVDSRVDPATIFDTGPGELFVIRNVANIVPPYERTAGHHGTSAALEYGVRELKIPDLLVLGHGGCGGIQALLNAASIGSGDFIGDWLDIASPARDSVASIADPTERQWRAEWETVKLSVARLMTFPWIAEAVADGDLQVQGAHFDVRTGELRMLNAEGGFDAVPSA